MQYIKYNEVPGFQRDFNEFHFTIKQPERFTSPIMVRSSTSSNLRIYINLGRRRDELTGHKWGTSQKQIQLVVKHSSHDDPRQSGATEGMLEMPNPAQ